MTFYERLVEETEIDEEAASSPALADPMLEVKEKAEVASDAGLTTPEFDRTIEVLTEQGEELSRTPSTGNATRRYIINTIGFLGGLYAFIGSTASIGSTPQGAALMKAAYEAMEKLLMLVL